MTKSPLVIDILVALAAGDNHGYGIYKQILEDIRGSLNVYERSIYRELPRLAKLGLIEVPNPHSKPVAYRLTATGRSWLRAEQGHLRQLDRLLRQRLS